jgi:hypothetical protein
MYRLWKFDYLVNDELYSMDQICELFEIEILNLIYIEKTVGLILSEIMMEKIYS